MIVNGQKPLILAKIPPRRRKPPFPLCNQGEKLDQLHVKCKRRMRERFLCLFLKNDFAQCRFPEKATFELARVSSETTFMLTKQRSHT